MYNYDFLCTYKFHEDDLQEDMYRIQLLQALSLDKWDDKNAAIAMTSLYNDVKDNSDVNAMIEKAKTSNQLQMLILLSGQDNYTIFTLLFKFELFDITHKCLCDVNKSQKISYENFQELTNLMAD
jgi:hypothetical protein